MIRPIDKNALELIIHFEGLSLRPYLCPAGKPTIGVGSIAYPNGKKVTMKDPPTTEAEALAYLEFELSEKADTIHRFLERNEILMADGQYSALVSFGYNCGCGPIIDSGRSLNEAVLACSPQGVADAILLYDKITVKKLGVAFKKSITGLTRRRRAEAYLFLNGVNKFHE